MKAQDIFPYFSCKKSDSLDVCIYIYSQKKRKRSFQELPDSFATLMASRNPSKAVPKKAFDL